MSNPHNLKPGQQLWFVYYDRRRGDPRYVEVKKVGRLWADVSGVSGDTRISLGSLEVDGRGYSSYGRCYLSRDEWAFEVALAREWGILRLRIGTLSAPPAGMTVERIAQINALLGGGS